MTTEFLITSLVVILLPGTGVLYTLALGMGGGFRDGLLAAFGCTLGIVPHILASVAGLAALLHASALAFETLRYLGVAYLLFIAWSLLRQGEALDLGPAQPAGRAFSILRKGILTNILNPKLSLFFLAFLPQFVPAQAPDATVRMLFLGGVFMALTFLVFALYAALAAGLRRQVLGRPKVMLWTQRSFAAALGLMGLRLALADR
ncbi:LysE family translocator [Shinella fusca]|jgi:threonine/homoserine/homoserine lactone efflux protein|uniref:Threonine/homoserine/homoserine lactone efflux protein n=1 Tax=Shinella fusca TaxID=544480 RepID=A0A7W8DVP3_9HYPH|nr:LysE family translocator [Shinella fusca]MBB5043161.1 threonine/homoserine/homoserine lactone efflux protein [Shinella fusca]